MPFYIMVRRLPRKTTPADLQVAFSKYGNVLRTSIFHRNRGYVDMEHEYEAKQALENLKVIREKDVDLCWSTKFFHKKETNSAKQKGRSGLGKRRRINVPLLQFGNTESQAAPSYIQNQLSTWNAFQGWPGIVSGKYRGLWSEPEGNLCLGSNALWKPGDIPPSRVDITSNNWTEPDRMDSMGGGKPSACAEVRLEGTDGGTLLGRNADIWNNPVSPYEQTLWTRSHEFRQSEGKTSPTELPEHSSGVSSNSGATEWLSTFLSGQHESMSYNPNVSFGDRINNGFCRELGVTSRSKLDYEMLRDKQSGSRTYNLSSSDDVGVDKLGQSLSADGPDTVQNLQVNHISSDAYLLKQKPEVKKGLPGGLSRGSGLPYLNYDAHNVEDQGGIPFSGEEGNIEVLGNNQNGSLRNMLNQLSNTSHGSVWPTGNANSGNNYPNSENVNSAQHGIESTNVLEESRLEQTNKEWENKYFQLEKTKALRVGQNNQEGSVDNWDLTILTGSEFQGVDECDEEISQSGSAGASQILEEQEARSLSCFNVREERGVQNPTTNNGCRDGLKHGKIQNTVGVGLGNRNRSPRKVSEAVPGRYEGGVPDSSRGENTAEREILEALEATSPTSQTISQAKLESVSIRRTDFPTDYMPGSSLNPRFRAQGTRLNENPQQKVRVDGSVEGEIAIPNGSESRQMSDRSSKRHKSKKKKQELLVKCFGRQILSTYSNRNLKATSQNSSDAAELPEVEGVQVVRGNTQQVERDQEGESGKNSKGSVETRNQKVNSEETEVISDVSPQLLMPSKEPHGSTHYGNQQCIRASTSRSVGEGREAHFPRENKFQCEQCKITCPTPAKLNIHNRTESHIYVVNHPGEDWDLTCKVCRLRLATIPALVRHKQGKDHMKKLGKVVGPDGRRNAAKALKCQPCNTYYSGHSQLRRHRKTLMHLSRSMTLGRPDFGGEDSPSDDE